MIISESANELVGEQFILINYTKGHGQFKGNYTSVTPNINNSAGFNQDTRNVLVNFGDIITYTSGIATRTIPKGDSGEGISEDRRMQVGICEDPYGFACSAGVEVSNPNDFSLSLSSGLSSAQVNDTVKYTRYVVINGIGTEFCIGPDLKITNVAPANKVVSSGGSTILNFSIKNHGNVDVTTDFNVTLVGPEGITGSPQLVTTNLLANQGNEAFAAFTVEPPITEGTYTYTAYLNDTQAGIARCTTTAKTVSRNVIVTSVVLPKIWINEVEDGNFDYAGQIYNVTIQLEDTDDNEPSYFANWSLEIREVNSYNIFAPLQYNPYTEKSFLSTVSTAYLLLDEEGQGQFTLSPMGSKAFETINETSGGLYSEKLSSYPKDYLSEYRLEFRVLDDNGAIQDVLYQGVPYVDGAWASFTFTNSSEFGEMFTTGTEEKIDSPNANVIEEVWNKLRQVALSLINRLQV